MAGLFEEKKVDAFLSDFRDLFSKQQVSNAQNGLQWGQFLDTTVLDNAQTGLYGAVAACLVFGAGDGANSDRAKISRTDLIHYWNKRKLDGPTRNEAENNLRQNVRLAFLLLGISFKQNFKSPEVQEVWNLLTERVIKAEGLWGAGFKDKAFEQKSSEYASALILIILTLIKVFSVGNSHDFDELERVRKDAALKLSRMYLSDTKRKRPYQMILLVAISISGIPIELCKKDRNKIRSELRTISFGNPDIKSRYIDFFEYTNAENKQVRDYLILPTGIFGAFLLLGHASQYIEYLYATRVLEQIEKSLKQRTPAVYMEGDRPSTLEQGFIVLALETFEKMQAEKIRWRLILTRAKLYVSKDNEFNAFVAWIFFVALYLPLGLFAAGNPVVEFLVGKPFIEYFIPLFAVGAELPKWFITMVGLLSGALVKPDVLLKAMIGKK